MTASDRIAEIEKRAQAATGIWRYEIRWPHTYDGWVVAALFAGGHGEPLPQPRLMQATGWVATDTEFDDSSINAIGQFIAHAREDIPYLLQALAASEARGKALEASADITDAVLDNAIDRYADGYDAGLDAAAKIADKMAWSDGVQIAAEIRDARKAMQP